MLHSIHNIISKWNYVHKYKQCNIEIKLEA